MTNPLFVPFQVTRQREEEFARDYDGIRWNLVLGLERDRPLDLRDVSG